MAQRQKSRQRVIVVVGPTASGKSALAVELARALDGEVISADSRQVYRGLDVGTGKITRREMQGVPHHLLDVANPKKIFTVHHFVQQAGSAIVGIAARGKLPIICGGTGFYIDALVGRIHLSEVPPDPDLRARLEKKTREQLFALLQKRDPKRAKTIDPRNKRRLVRALEIAKTPEKTPENPPLYAPVWIGMRPTDADLRNRINTRLSLRLKAGMIAEAKRLHAQRLSYKRMDALGLEYRSLARFLQKKINRTELEVELQHAIWRYARRQLTYWRRNRDIQWFTPDQRGEATRAVGRSRKH